MYAKKTYYFVILLQSNYAITNFIQQMYNEWLLYRIILGDIGKTTLISNNIDMDKAKYLKKIIFKSLETFAISFNHYNNPVKNALLSSFSKWVSITQCSVKMRQSSAKPSYDKYLSVTCETLILNNFHLIREQVVSAIE